MRRLAVITALCAVALGVGIARGELVQSGDLRIGFQAGFVPRSLPRTELAPVRVSLTGTVATADGTRPPRLKRISIALNRYGQVTTRGLPTCSTGELESTSTATALQRCEDAVVGRGHFGADVAFPNTMDFPVEGKILAFNSRNHGKPAIALHIYASRPITASVVLVFKISHRRRGVFGTVVSTRIPKIASDLGYVTDISLLFGRQYTAGGERLSFLSARCAAPSGFPGAIFPFAKGTFEFANGQRLTSTVARDCLVR